MRRKILITLILTALLCFAVFLVIWKADWFKAPVTEETSEIVDVYVFDVSKKPYPIRIFAATLQGIVNKQRDRGQIFLIYTNDDWHWINYYHSRFNITYEVIKDEYELLNLTKSCVNGFIIYDPEVPYSTDVAATIAGLNNSVVICPDMFEKVKQLGLDLDVDLRGIFRGMTKVEIYEWEYKYLWPLCNHTIIGNTYTPPRWIKVNLTSYLRESDVVYVKFEDAFPDDGFGSELYYIEIRIGSENVTYIVPGTKEELKVMYESDGSWLDRDGYRIADQDQYWIYKLNIGKNKQAELIAEIYQQYKISVSTNSSGPWDVVASCPYRIEASGSVPQIVDYLVSKKALVMSLSSTIPEERQLKEKFFSEMEPLGFVFGWHSVNGSEGAHVEQASQNGLIVLCCMESPNFSFHSKIKPSINLRIPGSYASDIVVKNKVYITFYHSDGDALWCLNNKFIGAWDSPKRGKFPLGWEIQPLLYDLAPGILQYYFESASEMDEFLGSCSGIGYIHPDIFPRDLLQQYLQISNEYFRKLGIKMTFVHTLYTIATDDLIDLYATSLNSSIAFFEGYFEIPGNFVLSGEAVWLRTKYYVGDQPSKEIIDDLKTMAQQTAERPLFIPVHVLASVSEVNEIIYDAISMLNKEEFEVVGPYEFALIAKKALKASNSDNNYRMLIIDTATDETNFHAIKLQKNINTSTFITLKQTIGFNKGVQSIRGIIVNSRRYLIPAQTTEIVHQCTKNLFYVNFNILR